MNRFRLYALALTLLLAGCQSLGDRETIATLRHVQIDIKEERIQDGLDQAMLSYRRFLEETSDPELTPEAIRRLADLKIEKEYGTHTDGAAPAAPAPAAPLPPPEPAALPLPAAPGERPAAPGADRGESDIDFEQRATQTLPAVDAADADDLERAGALEAIALYTRLLDEYPLYERNDQVLYQMSRAYEELGRIPEAMEVMDRLVREYPRSRYIDEVQFRRAEYFFTHRRYLDAEDAYHNVVDIGVASTFYELALYKLGWTYYKQELYDDALHRFIAVLDYKVSVGYDFAQTEDEQERKRTDDTFRVISLGFSNLGGADSVVAYFDRHGHRPYEDSVYSNLAEFYLEKLRYADASATYNAFVDLYPFHQLAPNFHMRVIEIHTAGGFPSLVLESKKAFATTYGLKADYWAYYAPDDRPEVLAFLKTNLIDLAHFYHAQYQDPEQAKDKPAHLQEALHWYRQFLASFPADPDTPTIHYQLADLLLENRSYGLAAVEYERTAYDYAPHEKASQAGYAAVYALREHLAAAGPAEAEGVKRDVVRSSLKFADTFPEHEQAAVVLGAAADDLFVMKEYEQALAAAHQLLDQFPGADQDVVRAAWLVAAHASYELQAYADAEAAYLNVLAMLPGGDPSREGLVDNLAASIYKQGEQANEDEDYRTAAEHFLRVGRVAPGSAIRANAEYDGAAALIRLEDWAAAAAVLVEFRSAFPGHPLQPDVTKHLAYVYRENDQLSLAAEEYERIEQESEDAEIRRDALLVAAELHEEDGNRARALEVYRRYVDYFPQPVGENLEARHKISEILKERDDRRPYLDELRQIVSLEAAAGAAQTARTRYLGGNAALVLAEESYEHFTAVQLQQPFEVNLRKKRDLMLTATRDFGMLVDYEIGDLTAAATYYLAEIYAHFSNALMTSERPDGLSPLELEEYELAIEEQAYPFEEQAISVHENNLQLISRGVYNNWIEKSLARLAEFVPARYAKPEADSVIVASLDTFEFEIERPAPEPPEEVSAAEVETTAFEQEADAAGAEAGAEAEDYGAYYGDVPVEAATEAFEPEADEPEAGAETDDYGEDYGDVPVEAATEAFEPDPDAAEAGASGQSDGDVPAEVATQ
jgi:cellulose synthase operon protein C